jgi:hypothetical protein
MENHVFLLWHAYQLDGKEESKFLGVFSNNEKAQEAIKFYRTIKGFNRFPNEFLIVKHEINKRQWLEGFATMLGGNDLFPEN